jgi:hypothetical protein
MIFIGEIERYRHVELPALVFCSSGYGGLRRKGNAG